MKISLLPFFLLFFYSGTQAQYYYKDLVSAQQLMEKLHHYKAQSVKSVNFLSFDANNQPIEGFNGGQTVSADFLSIETNITDPLSGQSQSIAHFDANGKLLETIDSSDGFRNNTYYSYDEQGRISKILTESISAGGFEIKELHVWTYNDKNKPASMLKIKNGKDTSFVRFVADDQGDPGEERAVHQGQPLPVYYYYFDQQHRLTDIVRYNERAKRLLPDYIFEYEDGRLATMLVVPEGNSDYQKWYYSYDADGLKLQDACYSKTQTLIGRVEYKYIFK